MPERAPTPHPRKVEATGIGGAGEREAEDDYDGSSVGRQVF